MNVEKDGTVATVTLLRLAMNPAFFVELEKCFEEINADKDLRAVVVRSGGKAFSYGLDLTATFQEHASLFAGGLAGTRTDLLGFIRRVQRAATAVAECPVPVIAAIHGWCIGGGLDLAAACDVRLASKDAKFSLRETKVAIVADLGSLQRLPAIIGRANTRELAFTGRDMDAERALKMGLVNELYEDKDAVHTAARKMAEEIAANPPLVVRGVKDVLNYGEGKTVTDGLAYVSAWNAAFLASEDLAEAVSAFMEKRKPEYKGK
ncbi:MAG: crotonase/enoyl-CoA hydratase family protein [Deltaproteobacteria bacterium]|nr:crotonase/enoyl-CoA hydratase family protein [Deltaproteobacteria bacterium]